MAEPEKSTLAKVTLEAERLGLDTFVEERLVGCSALVGTPEAEAEGDVGFRTHTLSVVRIKGVRSALLEPRCTVFLLRGDGEWTFGRGDGNDLPFSHASVSKRHASIKSSGGVVSLVDLGSANGTRVRGERVEPGASSELASGDAVTFGNQRFFCLDASAIADALRQLSELNRGG